MPQSVIRPNTSTGISKPSCGYRRVPPRPRPYGKKLRASCNSSSTPQSGLWPISITPPSTTRLNRLFDCRVNNTYSYAENNPIINIDPEGLLFFGGSSILFFRPPPTIIRPIIEPPVAGPKPPVVGPKPNVPSPGPEPGPVVIPNPDEGDPTERPWRKGGRWLVYVRCNTKLEADCEYCPERIGGKAYGGTFGEAFSYAQMDANRNLGYVGARNCQARHCQPIVCFENGRRVSCPKSGR